MTTASPKQHWESIYRSKPHDGVSWYQSQAVESMRLIRAYAPAPAAVIDVGGGASVLVDNLLEAGYEQPTVLDLSGAALGVSRKRLGGRAASVKWIESDVIAATLPVSTFDVWHDRAVFHFLVESAMRRDYVDRLRIALRHGGIVVMAVFAADGPERCSGLPTCRYNADQLAGELGPDFVLADARNETHRTPGGAVQRFLYTVFRRI